MNLQLTAPENVTATIALPSSKSITNRALLIAALCHDEPLVTRAALCDDTAVMMEVLSGSGGEINVGAAGTAMRFLTAFFATREGMTVILDGVERMRQRPIGVLVNALRLLGASIDYLGEEGYPPLRVTGTTMHGGDVVMDGSVSSQFISAVMMILPAVGGGTIRLIGDIVSMPYINMTAAVMTDMGADVEINGDSITVGNGYTGNDIIVETDWSAAAPWYALAALLPQAHITLEGLTADSIQGDAHLVELGSKLGIASRFDAQGVTLDTSHFIGCCCSCFADMTATPDLIPSWTVLLCLLERSFRITGTRTLRFKESDRIEALRDELAKLGYRLKIESDDAISWYGERTPVGPLPPVIDTHGDHRLAMAFAPAAVRFPGIVINDADVVTKSYPSFWRHLERCGFVIKQLAQ
ncbi:MAG: 3-phosphoshikimate 1-carboxyvinyltransferase [Muribaculaceae bacterium]|nr:3-phosphoshikimate 1-carboxyvinyltransferase [Muribaculaceae bacterium]